MLGLGEASAFSGGSMIRDPKAFRSGTGETFTRRAEIRACRRGRLEATGAVGTNGDHAVDGGSRLLEVRVDRFSGNVMERSA